MWGYREQGEGWEERGRGARKEWSREEREKREQKGGIGVGKEGRRGEGRWQKKSGNRKYVEGRRTGERQTLVHNISLDVCMF